MSPRERLRLEAERRIEAFLDMVSKPLKPVCVILFGSYARGFQTESSDIDLCVISDHLPDDIFERRTIVTGIPKVRAIGFTRKEFLQMLQDLNPLVLDIVYHGKPVLGEEVYNRKPRLLRRG